MPRREMGRSLHDSGFGDNGSGRDSGVCSLGGIRGGVPKIVSSKPQNSSRNERWDITSRHENRSCKYMEDMYSDDGYINVTSFPVRNTSESGNELISLRVQFIVRAEQHVLQHCFQFCGM